MEIEIMTNAQILVVEDESIVAKDIQNSLKKWVIQSQPSQPQVKRR